MNPSSNPSRPATQVSMQRTSENAFDTSSPVAMKLKRRVFEVLGMRYVWLSVCRWCFFFLQRM